MLLKTKLYFYILKMIFLFEIDKMMNKSISLKERYYDSLFFNFKSDYVLIPQRHNGIRYFTNNYNFK